MTPVNRTRVLLPLSALALVAVAVTGCSSSTSASSSSSSAAASPSISAGPDAALKWCTAYGEITNAMSAAEPTVDGAKTSMNALQSFDQLWAAGANLGYITTAESDANRRAIVAYSLMMQQIANGKKVDSQEVKDASTNLTTVTTKDKVLLQSSSDKVRSLCAPLTTPLSTASGAPAASGAASTPASAAASTPANSAAASPAPSASAS